MQNTKGLHKSCEKVVSKRTMPWVLGMGTVLVIFSVSYRNLPHLLIFNNYQTAGSTSVNQSESQNKSWLAGGDKEGTTPPTSTNRQGNALVVETNTGLGRVIILEKSRITIDLPFTSYSAKVTIETQPDVVSVSMNHLSKRMLTYALGLGSNQLDIRLKHERQTGDNSKTTSTAHSIILNRHSRRVSYNYGIDDEVCYLEQDCDMIVFPNRECGLRSMKYWSPSVEMQGYWKMKCNNCSSEQTCLWSKAEWIETGDTTILPPLPNTLSLTTCLKDHQMLFLGDSTLREMMHTLMEKVNTTLHRVEQTHGSKNYNNVGMATNFSFTYHPTFWKKNAPTLRQKLTDLVKNHLIKGEERKTVLVVGGLQWLTGSQITEIYSFITKKGIPSDNVFIKLYGSGFVVATTTTNILHNEESMRKLVKRNHSLRELAKGYEFGVVDTLQMTLSRYKEFHQGACACHFHQMSEYQLGTPTNEIWVQPELQKLEPDQLSPITIYHIGGEIHNSYTDILMRQMCVQHT